MRPDVVPVRGWHPTASRYRTIDEARILDLLLLCGWAFERRTDPQRCLAQAGAALERLVALGLPFVAATPRRFDPVEVINFVKWSGLRERDGLWQERFVATGRNLLRQLHGEISDTPPQSFRPQRFEATLRRLFNIAAVPEGQRLRLRMPLPIEDGALCDVRQEISQPADTAFAFATGPGRIEAVGPAPAGPTVALTLRLSFTATPGAPPSDTPPDRALTLQPAEGVVQVTARVRALAERLAAGDDAETVGNFWNFMLDHLCCGAVHYDQVWAAATDWVLDTGWYDCHLGSALLVALCRARAIPARLVGGHVLYPAAPFPHYWAEIWLQGQGWAPFDLLAWDLSAGGRDRAWRDVFRGRVDHRLKTMRMPDIFTGPMSIRLPAERHLLMRQTARGLEAGHYALADGAAVYRDQLRVAGQAHVS